MEDLLNFIESNTKFTLRNNNNLREVRASLNIEGWCVYNNDNNKILESKNMDEIINCFENED